MGEYVRFGAIEGTSGQCPVGMTTSETFDSARQRSERALDRGRSAVVRRSHEVWQIREVSGGDEIDFCLEKNTVPG